MSIEFINSLKVEKNIKWFKEVASYIWRQMLTFGVYPIATANISSTDEDRRALALTNIRLGGA